MTDAVAPTRLDSAIAVEGTDRVTVTGNNAEDTVHYYRELLGVPLVRRPPHLDQSVPTRVEAVDEVGLDVEWKPVADAPAGTGVDR